MSAKASQLTDADRRADKEMFDGLGLMMSSLMAASQNPANRAAAQRTKERLKAIAPSTRRGTPGDAHLHRAIADLTHSLTSSRNRSVSAAAKRFEAKLASIFPCVGVDAIRGKMGTTKTPRVGSGAAQ